MASPRGWDPPDDEIERRLGDVPGAVWSELDEAWAAVERETVHLRWEGGDQVGVQVVNGVEKPVIHVPYAVYSPAVERLRTALGAFVVTFAWPDWEGVQTYRGGVGMAEAPFAHAVRMVTAVIRSERFMEGSIGGAIEDGTLQAAVSRLRSWRQARSRS